MSNFGIESLLLSLTPVQKATSALSTLAAPYVNEYLLPYAEILVSNPWYCYGCGPIAALLLGMMLNIMLFEWLSAQPWMQKYMITYSHNETRQGQLQKQHAKVPWLVQFKDTLSKVGGPVNIVGCAFWRYSLEYAHGGLPTSPLPTLVGFCVDFYLMAMIEDFFLFFFHRLQHRVEWLWKFHEYHHRVSTTSASSTAYIDDRDALLQSALPLVLTSFLLRPHPVTHLIYIFHRLQNNVLNHAGIHCWWLNILTLKFLPLRCDHRQHDAHHRFSGFGEGAKSFSEWSWFWDWLFGTLSQTGEVMSSRKR